MIYAFEETGETRAAKNSDYIAGINGGILAGPTAGAYPILRPIPQAEIEAALAKLKACEEAERVRDWAMGRARCLEEERDAVMLQLQEAKAEVVKLKDTLQSAREAAEAFRADRDEARALASNLQQLNNRLRTDQHARDDDRTRFIRETAAGLLPVERDRWRGRHSDYEAVAMREAILVATALADALFPVIEEQKP